MTAIMFLPGLILKPFSNHKMLMSASKEIFTLQEKDALLMKSSLKKKQVRNDGKYNIYYNSLTSLQIFLIGQLSCFSRCIKNGKKKRKVILKTQ